MEPNDAPRKYAQSVIQIECHSSCFSTKLWAFEIGKEHVPDIDSAESFALLLQISKFCSEKSK